MKTVGINSLVVLSSANSDARVLTWQDENLYLISASAFGTGGTGGSSAWADITNKPNTLAGYGIVDGSTLAFVNIKANSNHSHSFASISAKPNTIAGYGIVDGVTTADLAVKANSATTLAGYGITDAATLTALQLKANVTDVTTGLATKADTAYVDIKANSATTLAGYGITDGATLTALQLKANVTDVITGLNTRVAVSNLTNSITGYSSANTIIYFDGSAFAPVTLSAGLTLNNGMLYSSSNLQKERGSSNLYFSSGSYTAEKVVSCNIVSGYMTKVWISADGNSDHNNYEHAYILPTILALTTGNVTNNTFSVYGISTTKLIGNVSINWEWSN